MMQHHGMAPACETACPTLHVPLSAMPRGSVPRPLALLVAGALASPHDRYHDQLAMSTRHAAHYASWAASWANATRMSPTAVPLSICIADLATSALPFAVGLELCDAHVHATGTTNRALTMALTALEDYLRTTSTNTPYPPSPLRALSSLSLLRLVSAR